MTYTNFKMKMSLSAAG